MVRVFRSSITLNNICVIIFLAGLFQSLVSLSVVTKRHTLFRQLLSHIIFPVSRPAVSYLSSLFFRLLSYVLGYVVISVSRIYGTTGTFLDKENKTAGIPVVLQSVCVILSSLSSLSSCFLRSLIAFVQFLWSSVLPLSLKLFNLPWIPHPSSPEISRDHNYSIRTPNMFSP
jgi:hypothetical protein